MKRVVVRALLTVLLAGCAGVFTSSDKGRTRSTAVGVVQEFCDRFGTRSYAAFLNLFEDEAVFELKGLGVARRGRAELRELAEYGVEVRSRLRLVSATQSGDTVIAELVEKNDWYSLLGVEEARLLARFVIPAARIRDASVEPVGESKVALRAKLVEFLLWLKEHHVEKVEDVLPGGRFRFSRETGTGLLMLLRKWRGQHGI